jgi:fibronectin type 3 domain-containing protein
VVLLIAAALAVPLLFQGKAPAAQKPKPHAQPLLPPSRLIVSASCDGFLTSRVSLSWHTTATRRADGYAVYRGQSPDGPFRKVELLAGRDSTSFVDTHLGDATRYYYAVRATSGSHLSPYSSGASVRTPSFCLF